MGAGGGENGCQGDTREVRKRLLFAVIKPWREIHIVLEDGEGFKKIIYKIKPSSMPSIQKAPLVWYKKGYLCILALDSALWKTDFLVFEVPAPSLKLDI